MWTGYLIAKLSTKNILVTEITLKYSLPKRMMIQILEISKKKNKKRRKKLKNLCNIFSALVQNNLKVIQLLLQIGILSIKICWQLLTSLLRIKEKIIVKILRKDSWCSGLSKILLFLKKYSHLSQKFLVVNLVYKIPIL